MTFAACGNHETESAATKAEPPPSVVVQTVRQQQVPISQDYQAAIAAVEAVDVSARVDGTLERVLFKEGSLVHRGQPLFVLQQNERLASLESAQAQLGTARAQVGQAEGNLASKRAMLQRASTTVARDRPLAAAQAIPQKDLDNAIQSEAAAKGEVEAARSQVASARAAVGAAQAAVDNAKINYGYTTIDAPVTGLIGFLKFHVGNVVGGSTTQVLDTITSIDPVRVTFALDEPTYLALSGARREPGVAALRDQPIPLILANNATYQYKGRIYAINPTIDQRTGTITVEARFQNPDGLLRPGGFGRVRLVVENLPNALLVPQTAIVQTQGVNSAYVVDGNGMVALRTVTLGPQYKQSYVVKTGLSAGDRVIVEGTQKARPGIKVVAQAR